MTHDCNSDALEALVLDQPIPAPFDRASLEAHVAECERCANELAWLRAERSLFAATSESAPSIEHLWPAIEKKLPPPPTAHSPYRTAAPPPVAAPPSRWRTYALVAASLAALGTLATFKLYRGASQAAHTINSSGREATFRVQAPLSIRVETASADVRIEAGPADRVRVRNASGDETPTLVRAQDGHYDVLFEGRNLAHGRVVIELPARSAIEVVTASGEVFVGELDGATKVRTSSGDVEVRSASDAVVTTASGDVELRSARGPIAIHTVSGDIRAQSAGRATGVSLHSTSGSLTWTGLCESGCRMNARSNSGDVELTFFNQSGATLRYRTTSGSIDDGLDCSETSDLGVSTRHFGSSAGSIDVSTTSGSLALRRAP